MKKYFLALFILLFLFVPTFIQPQLTFAAAATTGETWTWQSNGSITVTGGKLSAPVTIPKNGQTYFTINNNGTLCSLSILPQLSVDNKSATVEGGFNFPGQNPPHPACPASIQNQYYGTTVQIGGTPPGGTPLGPNGCPAGQYPFDVTYYDGNADNIPPAPASLTFTAGNQTKTAKGKVENGNFGVDVSYTATLCLAPGAQKVCVQPAQPDFSCSNFTMPKAPYAKTFGQRKNPSNVNVGVILVNTDQGPYTVTLTGNGINQTKNAQPAANQGTGCALEVTTTFFNIKPGSYQVCYKNNQCETLNQVAGVPGNVTINVSKTEQNGQSACVHDPTQVPPPPSPPCRQWSANGLCQSFGSTFGGFSTQPNTFIQNIFAILLSVSGGIALLLIIKAGYQLMTSQGNPEKLNNGREQLVAAIVGLVFLIFSFVFLQLIGFDILHIPGFGGTGGGGGASQQSCAAVGEQYCAKINSCYPVSSTCP